MENTAVSVVSHGQANPDEVARLVTKHAQSLITAIDLQRAAGRLGQSNLWVEGYCLFAYDRDAALAKGLEVGPATEVLVLGCLENSDLANELRNSLAADRESIELDPETLMLKHDGEYVDFDGKRGFFHSHRVPFFRLKRRRLGAEENGPGYAYNAIFSGSGRTASFWKILRDDGKEFPLCVDIYEKEIFNDMGLDLLDGPIRWELEFETEWPAGNRLTMMGVEACTIVDPNKLDPNAIRC